MSCTQLFDSNQYHDGCAATINKTNNSHDQAVYLLVLIWVIMLIMYDIIKLKLKLCDDDVWIQRVYDYSKLTDYETPSRSAWEVRNPSYFCFL